MAENQNAGAGDSQENQGNENDESTTSNENNGAGDSKGNDGGGDDKKGDDKGAGDGKGGDSKKDDKKSDDKSGEDDDEPQSRKSNAWWVAKRRGDKIEKITKKDGDSKGGDEGKGGDDDDKSGKGDDDFEKKLDEALDERLAPLKQETLEKEVDTEISKILADEPKFKPYADKVRKWALHPSRANVPVQSIFYEVAGKDLMKIGAEKAKEAEEEAKRSNGSGGGSDTSGGTKSVWDMTPEEFAAEKQKIRYGAPAATE